MSNSTVDPLDSELDSLDHDYECFDNDDEAEADSPCNDDGFGDC